MSSDHVPVADADLAAAVDPTSTSTPLTAIEPFNAAANYGKGAALRDSKTAILGQKHLLLSGWQALCIWPMTKETSVSDGK